MNGESKQVTCPGCGHIMVIPPEYANTPGRCRKCGGTVNEQPPLIPTVDLSDLGPTTRKPAAAVAAQPAPLNFKRALIRSILMGLAGALVGGVLLGTLLTVLRSSGQLISAGTFFANADTGLVMGFTLCSLFVLIRHLRLGPMKSAGAGLVICGTSATLMFALEALFVASPDMGLASEIAMAVLAGTVAGVVMGAKLNSDD